MPDRPPLRFTNTASGQLEDFVPLDPAAVGFYACGPTVYNNAHIGNLSTYIFNDLLKRTLRFFGYGVKHVMNITDVDDKMIRKAQELGISMGELGHRYTELFLADMHLLNLDPPEVRCMATDHVAEMISLVERLIERGAAYEREGSVYFSIKAFPHYGEFAHLDPQALENSARPSSAADEAYEKDDVRDFALWKAWTPDDGEVKWQSPWGDGRPGWHIECSAMSMKYLGETFDLHTGAIDLIFPHHQNEIAQSEAATGKTFVKYWLHRGFLTMGDAERMAKRVGNVLMLRDIAATPLDALTFRLLVLSAQYRSPLLFSQEQMDMHKKSLVRILELADALEMTAKDGTGTEAPFQAVIDKTRADFSAALANDLNTPEAFAAFFDFMRAANMLLAKKKLTAADAIAARALLADLDSVLGLIERGLPLYREASALTPDQQRRVEELGQLRAAGDYAASDLLRDELIGKGLDIQITKEGVIGKRRII